MSRLLAEQRGRAFRKLTLSAIINRQISRDTQRPCSRLFFYAIKGLKKD
ncbi:MAG: hypothetical protein MI740_01330 [Halanaerobiales bacterium]|nr:hypothetical protein [Halanaerobiales bacterium]